MSVINTAPSTPSTTLTTNTITTVIQTTTSHGSTPNESTTVPDTTVTDHHSTSFNAATSHSNFSQNFTATPTVQGPVVPHNDSHLTTGHIVAIVFLFVAVVTIFVCLYCYLKRTGKLSSHKFTMISRFRRGRRDSNASSRRSLDREEEEEVVDHPRPDDSDLFTIGDVEDNAGNNRPKRQNGTKHPHSGLDDDYFYDEVFGQSAFEDEATNTALKELTISSTDDDLQDIFFKE